MEFFLILCIDESFRMTDNLTDTHCTTKHGKTIDRISNT